MLSVLLKNANQSISKTRSFTVMRNYFIVLLLQLVYTTLKGNWVITGETNSFGVRVLLLDERKK